MFRFCKKRSYESSEYVSVHWRNQFPSASCLPQVISVVPNLGTTEALQTPYPSPYPSIALV